MYEAATVLPLGLDGYVTAVSFAGWKIVSGLDVSRLHEAVIAARHKMGNRVNAAAQNTRRYANSHHEPPYECIVLITFGGQRMLVAVGLDKPAAQLHPPLIGVSDKDSPPSYDDMMRTINLLAQHIEWAALRS